MGLGTSALNNGRCLADPFQALHKHIWQRIPYHMRRNALFSATRLAAPRISQSARPTTPVQVLGHIGDGSGLGTAARLVGQAIGTNPHFGSVAPPQISSTFARLAPSFKRMRWPATLLAHINAPFVPVALLRLGKTLVADKYIVGCWAWELPQVPADWSHGLPFVHEIWVPSHFTAAAVKPIANGRPVRVVHYPVAIDAPAHQSIVDQSIRKPQRRRQHSAVDPFRVLTLFNMASSFARKNPLAAVQAFVRAFGQSRAAHLMIKVSNGGVFPNGLAQLESAIKGLNVSIIYQSLNRDAVLQLYGQSDVLLSLHRSEGFGLPIAEAMLFGVPAVATDWSGNTDFLSSETGCPISYRLIPAEDPQHTYQYPNLSWADADIDAAAEALTKLAEDEPRRRALGIAAQRHAQDIFSVETFNAHVASLLKPPGIGEIQL
jgi:glycosyltransferase involved in cell wall biosynthesis